MIGYLTGTARGTDLVVCHGVGYRVATPTPLVEGETVELYVHTVVRETALDLFGFPTQAEELVFRTLLRATGVGPKLALTLLGHLGAGRTVRAVRDSDAKTLSSCPGIGPKMAQALCQNLQFPAELLAEFDADAPAAAPEPGDDVTEALVQLGFTAAEAADRAGAARAALPGTEDPSRLIRAALAHPA